MDKTGKYCYAIVLAAGSGSRMHSTTAKQFMILGNRPLLYYSLQAMEQSAVIDACILVTGKADLDYVRQEIVAGHGFRKVTAVVEGGRERYQSVWNALQVIAGKNEDSGPGSNGKTRNMAEPGNTVKKKAGSSRKSDREEYIFIQDSARPFLTEKILQDTFADVCRYRACVAAVPVKDTVKLADGEGFASETPDRSLVWSVQTPQVFERDLIVEAYGRLQQELPGLAARGMTVTDDASVVELFGDCKVRLTPASYENIKITTPEDIQVAEAFLKNQILLQKK